MKPIVLLSFLLFLNSCTVTSTKKNDHNPEAWAFPYFKKVDSINPILNQIKI